MVIDLYNLKTDPGELNNIAGQNKEVTKREYELMAGWVQYPQGYINEILKK